MTDRTPARLSSLPHFIASVFLRIVSAAASADEPLSTDEVAGQAQVEKVASNRRIIRRNGKIAVWWATSCKNPKHRDLSEGLIDPWLKTVSLSQHGRKVLACHDYATHPMSFYGDEGPWYPPVAETYPQGGYEIGVAFCSPESDRLLTQHAKQLLTPGS